jgi:hypothetical protein
VLRAAVCLLSVCCLAACLVSLCYAATLLLFACWMPLCLPRPLHELVLVHVPPLHVPLHNKYVNTHKHIVPLPIPAYSRTRRGKGEANNILQTYSCRNDPHHPRARRSLLQVFLIRPRLVGIATASCTDRCTAHPLLLPPACLDCLRLHVLLRPARIGGGSEGLRASYGSESCLPRRTLVPAGAACCTRLTRGPSGGTARDGRGRKEGQVGGRPPAGAQR